MQLRYIYSACVVITTPDARIVCDPWFTQGAFDGAWYQWPVIKDPISTIGEVDLIYISHIHPDHYDSAFLKKYLETYPKARLIIGKTEPPYLETKMRVDGFSPTVVETMSVGNTKIAIFANSCRDVNIDTALAVVHGQQSIVNLNDNPVDDAQIRELLQFTGGKVTLACLPYGGATNHPACLEFPSEEALLQAVKVKEEHFLDVFRTYVDALKPQKALAFAGKYWLGGPLAAINKYRGIPDATRALKVKPGIAFVLDDGGDASIDLDTMQISGERKEPYNEADVDNFLNGMNFKGYDYEREIQMLPGHELPLVPVMNTAIHRARTRVDVSDPLWICVHPNKMNKYLCFDMVKSNAVSIRAGDRKSIEDLLPRLEIFVDDRYLFGLLTRIYHWNNAMGGCHYRYARTPDKFRRDALDFLDVFHV